MSTMTVTHIDRPTIGATRLRLTTRGRRVLAGIVAAPAIAALGFAILSGGGALATNDSGAPAGTFDTVTVLPGESLWSIAEDIAPGHDPRDVVDAIITLNALPSAVLDAGQSLSVPTAYTADSGK
ncbi:MULTISPECIES: LysM peptidoglycan-binding domain-containing protein [unclassified Microbacterium]|uniref:LysM peptidoglycan-binding domain-containing protein n=1 Tax=unclassified Microbacterium TaxID=2609290 RepID=UPI0038658162